MAPHWSFLPGTYLGAESGIRKEWGDAGALSFSYMWSNRYKAPWYEHMYNFRKADGITGISYLHSVGMKYELTDKAVIEGAFGQAAGYMDQYFFKGSYAFPLQGNDLRTSWQFYGARDKEKGGLVTSMMFMTDWPGFRR